MGKKSKGKILVLDNYRSANTPAIQRLSAAVEEAGYEADIIRYDAAKAKEDLLKDYDAAFSSGSGKAWKTGEKDMEEREHVYI